MTPIALLLSVAVAGAFGAVGALASVPPPTVGCDQSVFDASPKPPSNLRVLFDRVAVVARNYRPQPVRSRPLGYWVKAPIFVRASSGPVRLEVPRRWRAREAITYGDSGIVRALEIGNCPGGSTTWSGYAGGFYLSRPSCVPLVVRVRGRGSLVRFGIGRSCTLG